MCHVTNRDTITKKKKSVVIIKFECSNSLKHIERLDPKLQITNSNLLSNNVCAEYENKLNQN